MSIYLARVLGSDGTPIAAGKRVLDAPPTTADWVAFGTVAIPDDYAGEIVVLLLVDGVVADSQDEVWPQ